MREREREQKLKPTRRKKKRVREVVNSKERESELRHRFSGKSESGRVINGERQQVTERGREG